MELINATIFVQAFNFFIAYCIIRTFLLKPALAHIHVEKMHVQKLNLTIDDRLTALTKKQQEKEQQWHLFHLNYQAKIPNLMAQEHKVRIPLPSLENQKIPEQELFLMRREMTAYIIERIGHVGW